MAQYNLIINGSLQALTTSGTGNTSLVWTQLESLQDGVTASGGVSLTTSGVLYLEADLTQRIKVDGIRLYASDLSKSANIKFYYKNESVDNYTLLTTQSGSYYYTTISDPSAPRYVRVTVSGVAITLHEFQIFNNDYIVAFGSDGSTFAEYLENTPVGELGAAQAVELFNNGTGAMAADAYTVIDYTGDTADGYVKISSSENGTYYGITDGALIEDDLDSSTYKWTMGILSNTEESGNDIIVSGLGIAGGVLLGELPLTTNTSAFATGNNTWDWDRVNKKMYAMGRDSSTLRLWEYLYNTDTWSSIGEVNPAGAVSTQDFPIMSYCVVSGTGRIYVMTRLDGTFGYYDLSGSPDNWTSQANPGFTGLNANAANRASMCSDGTRYIYSLVSEYAQSSFQEFKRFDTISGTWSDLDGGYALWNYFSGSNSGYTNTTCMTYDYDRDSIYLTAAPEENAQTDNNYIQRYVVSSDTWNTNYFYVQSVYNTSLVVQSISYHEDWLYVSCNPNFTSGYFFRYNISTTVVETINLGYAHWDPTIVVGNAMGVYILAIDPPAESSFESSVYFAQIEGERDKLVGYSSPVTASGTYTTPIFKLDNQYNSSYFTVVGDTTSGTGSISYDADVYNGTIRVKSSDTAPVVIEEVYWAYYGGTDGSDMGIAKNIIYTGAETSIWANDNLNTTYNAIGTAVDRRTGYVLSVSLYSTTQGWVAIHNRDGSTLYADGIDANLRFDVNVEFDKFGGVWGYGATSGYLLHMDNTLVDLYELYNSGTDFVYDLAAEMDGDGVWYTDKVDDLVIKRDGDGTLLSSIALNTPRAICGTLDNGCWVVDNYDDTARRYDSSGSLVKSVSLERDVDRMATDMNNGFWYLSGNHVYHVSSAGTKSIDIEFDQPTKIKGGHNGCIVWSQVQDYVKYIDKSTGAVTRTFTEPTDTISNITGYPALFSFRVEDTIDFQDTTNIIPATYDPVWGTGGTALWTEVRKDGYFLPKDRFHRTEITLRGDAILQKLIMPPAVRTQDIQSQQSKSMYIKTDIPGGADIIDYEARLRTWWGVE